MAIGDRVTAPGHVQLGELLLGRGTPYRWGTLTGWGDLPALDNGSVNRSDAHGAILGRLLAQPRVITVEGIGIRARAGELGSVVQQLEDTTAVTDDEIPLVVQLDERGPRLAWVRATARAIPVERGYTVGSIAGAALQLTATDPRRYELLERSAGTTLPSAEPGLDWNVNEAQQQLPVDQAAGLASASASFWALSGTTLGSSAGALTVTVTAASARLAWTPGPGAFSGFPVAAGQSVTFLADTPPLGSVLLLHWLDDAGTYVNATTGVRGRVSGTAPAGATQVRPIMQWATVPVPATVTVGPSRLLLPAPAEALVEPYDFGPPGSTGTMTATNAGNAPAHPVVEFRGPVIMPSLTNTATGDVLEYDLALAAGDVLTVDTAEGTVTLNGTASRLYTATSRSAPEESFVLWPGTADLVYRAAPESIDPAALVTVRWRSAYW
ncbi:phage distal tail protein [Streptomyces xanthochromogenes]|uniref:phage distal tail protein n=1 Tax=Streptomyces xanthochromogenes TaxID=67384 RepID=UPI00381747BD